MPDPTLLNHFIQSIRQFGTITGSYTTLHNYGVERVYRGLLISSSLDQDVIIRFPNSEAGNSEMVIPAGGSAGSSRGMDNARHNGLIEIKHAGVAPTVGSIEVTSWRAE